MARKPDGTHIHEFSVMLTGSWLWSAECSVCGEAIIAYFVDAQGGAIQSVPKGAP